VVARRYLIMIGKFDSKTGDASQRAQFELAAKACPLCFRLRVAWINSLEPRWGGSYAEMDEAAAAAPVAQNPKLKLLTAKADVARCRAVDHPPTSEDVALCTRAVEVGPDPLALVARARLYGALWDRDRERADLDAAVALAPEHAKALTERGLAGLTRHDFPGAADDLTHAWRIGEINDNVAKGLRNLSHLALFGAADAVAGDRVGEALPVLEAAVRANRKNAAAWALLGFVRGARGGDGTRELKTALALGEKATHQEGVNDALRELNNRSGWKALEAFATALLIIEPSLVDALEYRCFALRAQGKNELAIKDAEAACALGRERTCKLGESLKRKQ
jgi:hypothetical protein